jgi:hypothetical protein
MAPNKSQKTNQQYYPFHFLIITMRQGRKNMSNQKTLSMEITLKKIQPGEVLIRYDDMPTNRRVFQLESGSVELQDSTDKHICYKDNKGRWLGEGMASVLGGPNCASVYVMPLDGGLCNELLWAQYSRNLFAIRPDLVVLGTLNWISKIEETFRDTVRMVQSFYKILENANDEEFVELVDDNMGLGLYLSLSLQAHPSDGWLLKKIQQIHAGKGYTFPASSQKSLLEDESVGAIKEGEYARIITLSNQYICRSGDKNNGKAYIIQSGIVDKKQYFQPIPDFVQDKMNALLAKGKLSSSELSYICTGFSQRFVEEDLYANGVVELIEINAGPSQGGGVDFSDAQLANIEAMLKKNAYRFAEDIITPVLQKTFEMIEEGDALSTLAKSYPHLSK